MLFLGFSVGSAQSITIKKMLELHRLPTAEITKFLEIKGWRYLQSDDGLRENTKAHVYGFKGANLKDESLFIVQEPENTIIFDDNLIYQFHSDKTYIQLLKEVDALKLKANLKYSNLKGNTKVFQDGYRVITFSSQPSKTINGLYTYNVSVMLEAELDATLRTLNQ